MISVTKDFTVAHANQQRICLTCALDWEKNVSKKHEILKIALGDNVMGRTQNFGWFSRIACLGGWVGGGVVHQQRQTKYSFENPSQVRHLVWNKPGYP